MKMLLLLLLAAAIDYGRGRILPQDFVVSNDLTDRVDEAIVTVSVSYESSLHSQTTTIEIT